MNRITTYLSRLKCDSDNARDIRIKAIQFFLISIVACYISNQLFMKIQPKDMLISKEKFHTDGAFSAGGFNYLLYNISGMCVWIGWSLISKLSQQRERTTIIITTIPVMVISYVFKFFISLFIGFIVCVPMVIGNVVRLIFPNVIIQNSFLHSVFK